MSTQGGVARAVPTSRTRGRRRREWATTLTLFAFMAPLLIGLIVFLIPQRFIVEGVKLSGVKG